MFAHIFIYRLKSLLRNHEGVFWTLAFPMILALFFNMAFMNLNSFEEFKTINIAVVESEQYRNDPYFKSALNEVSYGDKRMFNVTVARSKEEADEMLDNNDIAGYIIVENPIKLIVKKSGIEQSIVKNFLDTYVQTKASIETVSKNTAFTKGDVFALPYKNNNYIKEVSPTDSPPNNVLNYFYTLIAMACFYGSFLGMSEVTNIQADLSTLAARINVAPVHKLKTFIYSTSASAIMHISEMFILLIFLRFVLGIDFGSKIGYVILTIIVGSAAGIAFGALVSAIIKKSENIKIGVLIGVTMTGSFLAGMMYQNMKYIVSKEIPVLSCLNPVNLLTDAFYCLYYYDELKRYAINICGLLIFIVISYFTVYLLIRRRKYASI